MTTEPSRPGESRQERVEREVLVRVAYETYGTHSPRRDNVILVCHAIRGDAHAADFAADTASGGHP